MAAKDFRTIITDIKNGNPAPVYLLMGEEPYYLDKIVETLEACVIEEADRDFNLTVCYGAETEIDMLVAAAQRYPMMSDRQLVILKEAQAMSQAKSQLDNLSAYIEEPNDTTVLAIVFKGDNLNQTSAVMKAAATNKDVVVFKSPKVKEYQLQGPIKDYAREKNINIDDKAASMLAEFVGNSLEKLFKEIDKLAIIVGNKGRITPEIIEKNIGISKDFNNFELSTALAVKNYSRSMRIVKHFASDPKRNPTVVTTATLFSFFQKLVTAHFTTDKSDRGLMAALGLKSSYALKDIKTGMQNYNAMQAIQAITEIRKFDTKSKGIHSFQNEYDLLKELVFGLITL